MMGIKEIERLGVMIAETLSVINSLHGNEFEEHIQQIQPILEAMIEKDETVEHDRLN